MELSVFVADVGRSKRRAMADLLTVKREVLVLDAERGWVVVSVGD